MADDPTIEELENPSTRTETATEIMYPDGSAAGLPSQPSSRATDTAPTADTGVYPDGNYADTDLPSAGREVLGQWLHNMTVGNIIPIDPAASGEATPTIDISDAQRPFSDLARNETFEELLRRQQVLPLGKGGNAMTLLRDVEGEDLDGARYNPAKGYVPTTDVGLVSPALSRNRFAPVGVGSKGPYMENPTGGNFSAAGLQKMKINDKSAELRSSLGKWNSQEGSALTIEQMQNVAEELLYNAVGDKKTKFANHGGNKDQATFGFGKASAQFGRGRAQDSGVFNADTDFRAANAIKGAVSGKRADISEASMINGAMSSFLSPDQVSDINPKYRRKTYGVLNHPLEPFAGALPLGMIVLALVAAIAVLIISLVLALIFDVLGFALDLISGSGLNPAPAYQESTIAGAAKMPMGLAFGKQDFGEGNLFTRLYAWLGLPTLEGEYPGFFKFTLAALTGAIVFFVPGIFGPGAGYYNVVTRNAFRDFDQIQDAAAGMGDGGGLTGAVEGFIGMIDAFRTSATFRFMVVLMSIGDRINCGPGLFQTRDSLLNFFDKLPEDNNNISPTIADLHTRSRLRSGNVARSLAMQNLPMYGLRAAEHYVENDGSGPASMPTTDPGIDANNPFRGAVGGPSSVPIPGENLAGQTYPGPADAENLVALPGNRLSYLTDGRISTEFREQLEARLNSYYVPFYFHDLRTNEILPLHTFVEGINDTYSPSYNEVGGFGRMDKVQIYGGTTRKIGLSFYMVATSDSDYSTLYYAVNRLVAMVYPQWSKGRKVSNSFGEFFNMPFSSVPTASPLIRMRLGELFASNQTTDQIRRMFGTNEQGFVWKDEGEDEALPYILADQSASVEESETYKANASAAHVSYWSVYQTTEEDFLNVLKNYVANLPFGGNILDNPLGAPSFFLPTVSSAIGNAEPEDTSCCAGVGTVINIPPGAYRGAIGGVDPTGFKKGRLGQRLKVRGELPAKGVVVNYAVSGKRAKVHKKSGGLRNTFYYVVAPYGDAGTYTDIDRDFSGAPKEAKDNPAAFRAGALIPMDAIGGDNVDVSATIDLMASLGGGLPIPPLPGAPDPPPPPRTPDNWLEKNAIVKSLRASGGDGLAGVITSLDFNWNEAPWETSGEKGRAPQYCKVTISFTPIHDEPLGLASDGSLRSAAYPVGDVIARTQGKRFTAPGKDVELMLAVATAAMARASSAELDDEGAPSEDLEE